MLLLTALSLGGPFSVPDAAAQGRGGSDAGTAGPDAPRVGLALSGGVARGFAHVGVLRVLEEAGLRLDAVAGSSMGAVVGGLYAAGYGPGELAGLARRQDWLTLFSESQRPPGLWPWSPAEAERHQLGFPLRGGGPTLPTGLVTGQRITQLLSRLTWHVQAAPSFRDLPVPFAALATDVETGEAVPLLTGSLPLAIRASIAIPSVFTPVEIGDRVLVDGSVSRPLPVQDVRDLGADVVVCSDVTEPLQPADSLRSFLDVLRQTVSYRTEEKAAEQRKGCDVLIRPTVGDMGAYTFREADAWIERGVHAARSHRERLRDLAARQDPSRRQPSAFPAPGADDSVFVAEIRFPDLGGDRARYLRRTLALDVGAWTTVDAVDRAVGRLYDRGTLARASYTLDAAYERPAAGDDPRRRVLTVRTTEEGRNALRIGFRFDSRYEAALLATLELHHALSFGSTTRLDARLGDQLLFDLRHRLRPGLAPGFLVGAGAGFRRTPVELFFAGPDGPVAETAVETAEGLLFLGKLVGAYGVAGLEGGAEWWEEDPEPDALRPDDGGWLGRIGALLTWDSRSRSVFPPDGLRADLRLVVLESVDPKETSLVQTWGDVAAHLPLVPAWTLEGRVTAGSMAGDAPPLPRQFLLGGTREDFVFPRRQIAFPGLRVQERRGEHLQRVELGVQVEVADDLFLSAGWVTGAVADRWDVRPSAWDHGFRLGLGLRTPVGPAHATLSDATSAGGPRLELDLGGRF